MEDKKTKTKTEKNNKLDNIASLITIRNYVDYIRTKHNDSIKNYAIINNDHNFEMVPQDLFDKANKFNNILNIIDNDLEKEIFKLYK